MLCCAGCGHLWGHPPPPSPAIRVAVGPVIMEPSITRATQIHSFDEPLPENQQPLLAQLIDEIQARAQKKLTEFLADQEGFTVVPFTKVRRMQADVGPARGPWQEAELAALGRRAGADVVISTRIVAYGFIPWKYILLGLATETSVEFLVVGFASGWNPAAIGTFFAVDVLLIDAPIWFGGAYVFGWAFRPVDVEGQAVQLTDCEGRIWKEHESAVMIPRKTMAAYPPEQRARKELQLQVNLDRALSDLAEEAGQGLRLQPCTEEGRPLSHGGWFDFLIP